MEPLRSAANVAFAIIAMASLVGQSSARPQPDEMEEMKKALYSACSAKNPITDGNCFLVTAKSKCFIMCAFDELSLIDEEGEIDGETMLSMITDDMKSPMEKALKTCLPNIAGKPDACEVAYNFLTCGVKVDSILTQMLPV